MPTGVYQRKPFSKQARENMRNGQLGKKHSPESIIKMRKPKSPQHIMNMTGNKNHEWKGNSVSYDGLHHWLRKYLPKPDSCTICHQQKKLEVSNISGKYLRDLNDYEWICRKCHVIKDGLLKNLRWNKPKEKKEK